MEDLWLAQYLCPNRHAIAAVPYDRARTTPADAEAGLLDAMKTQAINHKCGLCGSQALHFEHGKLKASNWDEAVDLLLDAQRDQILTRLSVDQQKDNTN